MSNTTNTFWLIKSLSSNTSGTLEYIVLADSEWAAMKTLQMSGATGKVLDIKPLEQVLGHTKYPVLCLD